jgi:hypothetical protein
VLDSAGDVTQAATQQCELELWHVADGALHETTFDREERSPAYRAAEGGTLAPRTAKN